MQNKINTLTKREMRHGLNMALLFDRISGLSIPNVISNMQLRRSGLRRKPTEHDVDRIAAAQAKRDRRAARPGGRS